MRQGEKYQVTRQLYYYQGLCAVELSTGGIDGTGCDMLYTEDKAMAKLEGGYDDPREAAEAAIQLRELWASKSDGPIGITWGYNLDMIEGEVAEEPDYEELYGGLRKWAEEEYERLPKCHQCGEIVVEEYVIMDEPDLVFCREYCAEKYWEEWYTPEEEE